MLDDQLSGLIEQLLKSPPNQVLQEGPRPFVPAPAEPLFVAKPGDRGADYVAPRLLDNPIRRFETAARLHSQRIGGTYARMLDSLLAQAERIWGPRGSEQALVTCVFFSLLYAYALFWLSIASGWENPLAAAIDLDLATFPAGDRWLLFAVAVLLPVAMWPVVRRLGLVEEAFKAKRLAVLAEDRRKRWLRRYAVLCAPLSSWHS